MRAAEPDNPIEPDPPDQGAADGAPGNNGEQSSPINDEILAEVYDELRRLAGHYLAHERQNHTLQPTALVHEAFLRLADQQRVSWENRHQFIAAASSAIRRILVDYARAKKAAKRRPTVMIVPGDGSRGENAEAEAIRHEEIEALDEALNRLAGIHPRYAKVVELRHFGGLSIEHTARALGVSHATVERDWHFARAWLKAELASSQRIRE